MFSSLLSPSQRKATRATKFLLDEWFERDTLLRKMYLNEEMRERRGNGAGEERQQSDSRHMEELHHSAPSQIPLPVYIGTWWPNASAWMLMFSRHLFDEWVWELRGSGSPLAKRSANFVPQYSTVFPGVDSMDNLAKVSLGILNILLYDVHKECRYMWFANVLHEHVRERRRETKEREERERQRQMRRHGPNEASNGSLLSGNGIVTSNGQDVTTLSDVESQVSHSSVNRSLHNSVRSPLSPRGGGPLSNGATSQTTSNPSSSLSYVSSQVASYSSISFIHWQKTHIDLSLLKLMYSLFSKQNDQTPQNQSIRVVKRIIFGTATNRQLVFSTLGALAGWFSLASTTLSSTSASTSAAHQEESLLDWEDPYIRWKTLVDSDQILEIVASMWEEHVKKGRRQNIPMDKLRSQPCPARDSPHADKSILLIRLRSEIEAMQCLSSLNAMLPEGVPLLDCFGSKISLVIVGLVHSIQWRQTSEFAFEPKAEPRVGAFEHTSTSTTQDEANSLPDENHATQDAHSEASELSDIFPSSSSPRSERSRSVGSSTSGASLREISTNHVADVHSSPVLARTNSHPTNITSLNAVPPLTLSSNLGNASPSRHSSRSALTSPKSTPKDYPQSWVTYYRQLFDRLLMNHLFMSVFTLDLMMTPQYCRSILEHTSTLKSRYGPNPLASRLLNVCNAVLQPSQLDASPLSGKLVFLALNIFTTIAQSSQTNKEFEEYPFQQFISRILLCDCNENHKTLYQSLQVQVLQLITARHSIGMALLFKSEEETNRPVLASICSLLIQMIPHSHTHTDTVVPVLHFLTHAASSLNSAGDLRSLLIEWIFRVPKVDTSQQLWPPKAIASQLSWQSGEKILETYQKKYSLTNATESQQALAEAIDQFFKACKGENPVVETSRLEQTPQAVSTCKMS
uniref:Uncharacterized protein n=1 Tax=Percolomonas cosmopolitus TaxID=63605 RepID=A0A7S1KPL3_9EUKA|eukprot:CAMPEP_0117439556 /NCGR_PEP_ID=MMETSP0759-20121206/2625_1 /TAXON_ID=63605 /ORGANISM="Percolomonas cosmopolitus, Strain WS" /LENGTH=912 /DNA_ID=CAMNT_0005231273 /DNA_START=259 /DNA_END=2997 /DNA_ORIENTATION=+